MSSISDITPMSLYRRTWRDKRARLAKAGLILLVIIALFADFIASDIPIYYKIDGDYGFPAFHKTLNKLGLTTWSLRQKTTDWKSLTYEKVIFAPIPYSATETDLKNANFIGPFEHQNVSGIRFRHWLGTDHLGRDVLAGLIHGVRITLLVGVCSILLAALFGIPLGAMAGFLGDDRFRMRFPILIVTVITTFLCIYFIIISFSANGRVANNALLSGVFSLLFALVFGMLVRRWWQRASQVRVPVDTLVLRSIEIIRSIPAFFLLFAILGMLRSPRMIYVILLIAFLYTPSIIRFVRAEALKLRNQTFIQSATVLGLTDLQIVFRHIIPNAIAPALITIAFGIGSAVLIESGLSFLGIGIAPESVSWGKMLNHARSNFSAWWMALLPGVAIFLTIAIFNRLGDVLEAHISGR